MRKRELRHAPTILARINRGQHDTDKKHRLKDTTTYVQHTYFAVENSNRYFFSHIWLGYYDSKERIQWNRAEKNLWCGMRQKNGFQRFNQRMRFHTIGFCRSMRLRMKISNATTQIVTTTLELILAVFGIQSSSHIAH